MPRKPPPKGYEYHPTIAGLIRRTPSPEEQERERLGLLSDNKRGAVSPLGGVAKAPGDRKGK